MWTLLSPSSLCARRTLSRAFPLHAQARARLTTTAPNRILHTDPKWSQPRNQIQMEYYAKSLSARTADSEPSLLLRFSTGQYLFNAGEGSQRAFGETVTSAKALETIFLTGLSTDEAGGLTGQSSRWPNLVERGRASS